MDIDDKEKGNRPTGDGDGPVRQPLTDREKELLEVMKERLKEKPMRAAMKYLEDK